MHTMSADMKKIPLGPPPSYDTPPLDLGDGKKQRNVGLFSLLMEDPPPYKENNSPTESFSSFQFLPPLALRPWKRFFSMCLRGRYSSSAENFGHNLVYYQVNYAWLMLLLVMVALVVINSDDFNFCILWTSITVLLIYGLNVSGFVFKLFGRRLSLSEQLTAFIMLELPFYGLLPGAVPFIYFIVGFTGFVTFHASFTRAYKPSLFGISKIHHI